VEKGERGLDLGVCRAAPEFLVTPLVDTMASVHPSANVDAADSRYIRVRPSDV